MNRYKDVQQVRVDLQERSYDIVVGNHVLEHVGKRVKQLMPLAKQFIITDEHVASHHLQVVEASFKEAQIDYQVFILPAGEKTKSFTQLQSLLDDLLACKPERNVGLVALGGGVIGDLTGFVASILLRGVHFIQIPTTLLAQVDSSVGGKTGINTSHGKNLVGSFYQPKLVMADMTVLETLPDREYKSGYAEVVKYGLINNAPFFEWLETQIEQVNQRETECLRQAVVTSCKAKADIVAQDEREGGVRALLNLGHTFGHALEVIMQYDGRLLHGEAVAIGLVMAYRLSSQMGLSTEDDVLRVVDHLKAVGLPTSPYDVAPEWNEDDIVDAMYQDKKITNGKMVLILPNGIGDARIVHDVDEQKIRTLLSQI